MEGAMQQAPQPARHSMKTSQALGGRDLNACAPQLPSFSQGLAVDSVSFTLATSP
jgi:hypothetical protein